jgi:(2Fe-2S) ferredoxin
MIKLSKVIVWAVITALFIGCGSSSDSKDEGSKANIENLLSTGVLSGTTKSTLNNTNTDVKISKNSGNYEVEYPSLACKGTLEVISTSATEMIFKVHFTEGSCLDGTKLKLSSIGENQVKIDEYSPDQVVTPVKSDVSYGGDHYGSFAFNNGEFHSNYYDMRSTNNGKTIELDDGRSCAYSWISIPTKSNFVLRFKQSKLSGSCDLEPTVEVRKDSSKGYRVTYYTADGAMTRSDYLYYKGDLSTGDHSTNDIVPIISSSTLYGSFIFNDGNFHSNYYDMRSTNNGKTIELDDGRSCAYSWISIPTKSNFVLRFKQSKLSGSCDLEPTVEVRKDSSKGYRVTYYTSDGTMTRSDYLYYKGDLSTGDHSISGSTSNQEQSSQNTTYTPTTNTQTQSPTYNTSNDLLGQKVSNELAHLVAYKVSPNRQGVFAIGIKDNQYAFYRFGLESGTPELEKKFLNVGLDRSATISSIDAIGNGRFKIHTSKGDYTYNYFDDGGFE